MEYTKVPVDAFQRLQMNAGILVKGFNPATGVFDELLGATTGGLSYASNPSFEDFGEDIDNVPNNTLELKRITQYDPTISGTFLTVTPAVAGMLVGSADVSGIKVTPKMSLEPADFQDVWMVGDYSDKNEGTSTAGFIAIHLMNALNTAGFQMTTSKNAKGQFAFEMHGHYSISNMDVVPFEIYIKAGESTATPSINLSTHAFTIGVGDTQQLTAAVSPADATITWTSGSDSKATVADGLVTGASAGSAIITASITVDGVTYTDTCTVVVE